MRRQECSEVPSVPGGTFSPMWSYMDIVCLFKGCICVHHNPAQWRAEVLVAQHTRFFPPLVDNGLRGNFIGCLCAKAGGMKNDKRVYSMMYADLHKQASGIRMLYNHRGLIKCHGCAIRQMANGHCSMEPQLTAIQWCPSLLGPRRKDHVVRCVGFT